MKSRLLLRFVICVVITSGITAWVFDFVTPAGKVPGHNVHSLSDGLPVFRMDLHPERTVHPLRHELHVFRKGVYLPSLHSSYPCSVLGHRPCIPFTGPIAASLAIIHAYQDIDYPIGQTLQLTIVSRTEGDKSGCTCRVRIPPDHSSRDLNTIRRCVFRTESMLGSARKGCRNGPALK